MDYKKIKTETTTVTRNIGNFSTQTGNVYKTICMLAKRSGQINTEMKKELMGKLEEFALSTDNLEEVFENREQIEIARYYERLPKPMLIAIHEYIHNQLLLVETAPEEVADKKAEEEI